MTFPLWYWLNIVSVAIALAAAWILYNANQKFMGGDFKRFSRWVVITTFLFLYNQVFFLFSLQPDYFGISREAMLAVSMIVGIIISIGFIMAAHALHRFSQRYGFHTRNKNLGKVKTDKKPRVIEIGKFK